MKLDLSCPIEVRGIEIAVFDRGLPCAYLNLYNLSNHTIRRLRAVAHWTDSEGNTEDVFFSASDLSVHPRSSFSMRVYPESLEGAMEAEIEFERIRFRGETQDWVSVPESQIQLPQAEPISSHEETLLLRAAGHGAVQFSQMLPGAWVCVCGRPNSLDADKCVRCMRGREVCLTRFSKNAVMALDLPPLPEIVSEEPPEPVLPFDIERPAIKKRTRRSKDANIRLTCTIIIFILLICIAILLFCRKDIPQPLPAAQTGMRRLFEIAHSSTYRFF